MHRSKNSDIVKGEHRKLRTRTFPNKSTLISYRSCFCRDETTTSTDCPSNGYSFSGQNPGAFLNVPNLIWWYWIECIFHIHWVKTWHVWNILLFWLQTGCSHCKEYGSSDCGSRSEQTDCREGLWSSSRPPSSSEFLPRTLRMHGGKRGLVAPQNTFLENIVRRSSGEFLKFKPKRVHGCWIGMSIKEVAGEA